MIVVTTTVICFGQQNVDSFPRVEKTYSQKSKSQKSTAIVLLAAGGVLDIIAIATFPKDYALIDWGGNNTDSEDARANTSGALFLVGTLSMLGSIPFFIVSHVNKKKALNPLSIKLNTQHSHQMRNRSMQILHYPAITLSLRL